MDSYYSFLMTIYDLRVLYSVCFWLKAKNGEKTSELPYERCSKNIYNFCWLFRQVTSFQRNVKHPPTPREQPRLWRDRRWQLSSLPVFSLPLQPTGLSKWPRLPNKQFLDASVCNQRFWQLYSTVRWLVQYLQLFLDAKHLYWQVCRTSRTYVTSSSKILYQLNLECANEY